ncbi:preprotein translocase subunit TatB [Caulobacter sp. Root655]|uniref:Sec-independent protein translocase protein TatB n=1 Tax=Caulobacter sp. Root655 TaxID=1736578 RepID=UPI0007010BEE|nr:Sec-independent protein translocase protein TatB [Caulobacter sp. Root655]KRA59308.1 preprotein translocase subunit TatB [Caulobacter sp. Root655]
MLPDIGGTELLVIAAVALIVVGPKDLPVLLRKLGQFVARIRGMANEFRASFDEMARQSELDELRKEVQAMREGQYTAPMRDAASQAGDASHVDQVFADIDASLNSGAVQVSPHAAYQAADPTIHLPEPTVEIVSKPARKPRAAKPAPAPAPKPTVEIVSKPRRAVAKADKTDISVPAKPARKRAPKSDIAS